MATHGPVQTPSVGFDFDNYARNQFLGKTLGGLPKGRLDEVRRRLISATSTGTTIVGLKFGGGDSGDEEGVCLGADTRATGGPIVQDKNCEKVGCDGIALDGRKAHVRFTIWPLTCAAVVLVLPQTPSAWWLLLSDG